MTFSIPRVLAGVFCVCGLLGAAAQPHRAAAKAEVYPVTPFAAVSGDVTGTVGGAALKFEHHTTTHPAHPVWMQTTRARFAVDSAMPVELTVPSSVQNPVLYAVGRTLPITQSGTTLTFTIPGPGHYYIEAQGIDKKILLWVDDLRTPRVAPGQPNVIDVTTRGISSNASVNQAGALQNLINTAPDGATLYFPAGVYRSGSLSIRRSNLKLYFDRGALLKGTDAVGDYRDKAFIFVQGVSNLTIAGPGTIDANGMKTWARMAWENDDEVKIRNLEIRNSNNITVTDVLLMDSNSWALHFEVSSGVTIRNVKVFGGKDGIDPDNSSHVVIDTVYVQSVDDALAFKTQQRNIPFSNARVTNCILSSGRATGIKFGTENYSEISGVHIEQCDVIDSDRGISFYLRKSEYGVRDITFKNVRVRSTRDALKNDPVEAGKDVHISNVRYENVVLELNEEGTIVDEYSQMRGIFFSNLQLHVNRPTGDKLLVIDPRTAIDVAGLEVFWRGHKNGWNGLFAGPQQPNLSGVTEHDGWGAMREFPPLTPDLPVGAPASVPGCKIAASVQCAAAGTAATVSFAYTQPPNYALDTLSIRVNGNPSNTKECTDAFRPGNILVDWYCDRGTGRGEDQFFTVPAHSKTRQFAVTPGVPYQARVSGDKLPDGTKLPLDACSSPLLNFTCQAPEKPQATARERLQSLIESFGKSNCQLNKIGNCSIDIFDYNLLLGEL